ncbi:MAG: CDP-alcohol phosphatidyltransferase family protein [Candidatus Heimdallarchaeota archaeon]|jgi:archaetidylinositol phosphate synthase|nr:CDP-alcohol phosphatidyltransferase family protein [Candidatus Heimdallarchaeota archaeon]MCK4253587.1 CDP-alcohol phosphatidyltransferase family protein [Candidatus Heimdallarchaeota archaeon]
MVISQIREPLTRIVQPVIIFFAKLGLHPTVFTVIGLLLSISTGIFLAIDNFLVAFILIFFGGAMDFIDGGVARYRKLDSKQGSFLDSIFDRISDVCVFGGIIFSSQVDPVTGIVMVAASLLISYIRAKGESVGVKKMAMGIMERAERWLVLMVLMFVVLLVPSFGFQVGNLAINIELIGLHFAITGFSIGYMVLTALCVITVIQRFVYVSIQLKNSEPVQEINK